MTIQTDALVSEALVRLAVARAALVDEVAVAVYLDALADVEPTLIVRACAELAKAEREDFESALPSVGAIRAKAERIARDEAALEQAKKMLPLPKPDEDGPRFFCRDCRDESSGWRSCWCQGSGLLWVRDVPKSYIGDEVKNCGRPSLHKPHPYVVRCSCWQVNPVVAARKAKYAGHTQTDRSS